MISILVLLPVLWGFWDGAAASYMWNRNVLLAVAKGWFIGIVIGVILPFVSSSGIFCPCSKQKINFKNPVEPVTCKSSEWGEVQWKLKQFINGVRWGYDECREAEFGLSAEELSKAAVPWGALGVTIPKPSCQRMRSTPTSREGLFSDKNRNTGWWACLLEVPISPQDSQGWLVSPAPGLTWSCPDFKSAEKFFL